MTEDETPDGLRLARQIADSYRSGGTAPLEPKRSNRKRRLRVVRENSEDPQALGDVLNSVMDEQGWAEKLANTRVFTDWPGLVGPDIASHSAVEQFEEQILHVRTSSTAWAKELKLLAPQLVAKLNDELGHGSVTRIEVRGPAAPNWSKGPRHVKGGRGPRDTYG
jgi:predicted nucleic acid-binding Zn ribbon protein